MFLGLLRDIKVIDCGLKTAILLWNYYVEDFIASDKGHASGSGPALPLEGFTYQLYSPVKLTPRDP